MRDRLTSPADVIRQYRRWAELYAHLVTDRPLPPSAEDKVQLRESGLRALQSLLDIVSGHLLMYVAPSTEVLQASPAANRGLFPRVEEDYTCTCFAADLSAFWIFWTRNAGL